MDLQSFDWSLLKVFVAVADTGSINAAAQQLGHSQAKVSRDIDLLGAPYRPGTLCPARRGAWSSPAPGRWCCPRPGTMA